MIALGSDHAGFFLKEKIKEYLQANEIAYQDYGTYNTDMCDYPVYGEKVGRAVASGECEKGLVFCGSGIGISVAACKVKGTRVATCSDCHSAQMARLHGDSNILALGATVVGQGLAEMIVDTWLNTPYDPNLDGGRHAGRIAMLDKIQMN